jgi:hypothetical protein
MKQIYVFDRHEVTIFETHIYSYFVLFKPTTHYHYFFIGYNLQNFEKKEIIFRKPGLQIIYHHHNLDEDVYGGRTQPVLFGRHSHLHLVRPHATSFEMYPIQNKKQCKTCKCYTTNFTTKKKLMNQCVNFPYIIVFRSIWSTQNESFLLVWVLTTTSSTVGSLPNSAAFHKHKTKTNFSFVPNTSYIQNSSFSKTIDLFICVEFIYMINSSIL